MAIKIPSKHIYNIDNPKILKNLINNVTVESNFVKPNNEYKVPVENVSFESGWETKAEVSKIDQAWKDTPIPTPNGITQTQWERDIAYISLIPQYKYVRIRIDKLRQNELVSKIYNSYTENADKTKNPDIVVAIHSDKEVGTATATGHYNVGSGGNAEIVGAITKTKTSTVETQVFEQPKLSYLIASLPNDTIIDTTASATVREHDDYFVVDVIVLVGYEQVTMSGHIEGVSMSSLDFPPYNGNMQLTGNYVKYTPIKLELTYYGNTFGIDIQETTTQYGVGQNPFILSRNELIEQLSYTGTQETTDFLANNILTQYINGKETAVVSCIVGEYYDENENLAISTKQNDLPMTFNIGDIVIPMVRGANGSDQPMSKLKSGEPKQFRVVGVKTIYDGAILQEITLQEY